MDFQFSFDIWINLSSIFRFSYSNHCIQIGVFSCSLASCIHTFFRPSVFDDFPQFFKCCSFTFCCCCCLLIIMMMMQYRRMSIVDALSDVYGMAKNAFDLHEITFTCACMLHFCCSVPFRFYWIAFEIGIRGVDFLVCSGSGNTLTVYSMSYALCDIACLCIGSSFKFNSHGCFGWNQELASHIAICDGATVKMLHNTRIPNVTHNMFVCLVERPTCVCVCVCRVYTGG